MLTVYLLRHGETTWNADGNRYCGITDVELTDKGLSQAAQARELLSGIKFDAIYSSPLQRAFITATITSGGDVEVIKDPLLLEAAFGQWEGKTRAEFVSENPELWQQWDRDPDNTRAGITGDTASEVVERVNRFFEKAVKAHPGGTILVVAHNTVNRFYLAHKLGMPLKNYRRIFQENSAITQFTLDDNNEITLNKLNCR
jgi:broad specificity phosphatase PhoE